MLLVLMLAVAVLTITMLGVARITAAASCATARWR